MSSKGKKGKTRISLSPFDITTYMKEPTDESNKEISKFIHSTSLDEQLAVLKTILGTIKNGANESVIKFLVTVFFYTEPKHPLKGLLARNINQNKEIHQKFSELLSVEILYNIQKNNFESSENFTNYTDVISKVFSCVENFNPGTDAVINVAEPLYKFLLCHLQTCIQSISDYLQSSSITEVYSSIQLTLRLLLYMIQKMNNSTKRLTNFKELRDCIVESMLHDHMPMDTKSVAAILLLATFDTDQQNGWFVLLNSDAEDVNNIRNKLLTNDAAKVCLYAAIVTTVPMEKLQCDFNGVPLIIHCLDNILEVSERRPDHNGIMVSTSRAVNHVSINVRVTAWSDARVTQACVRHACVTLDHPAHAIRHLAAHTLAQIVAATDTRNETWGRVWSSVQSLGRVSRAWHACVRAACQQCALTVLRVTLPAPKHILPALPDQHVQAQATAALEAYIDKYAREGTLADMYQDWVMPILQYITENSPDTPVITIMENLLVTAININHNILQFVVQYMKGTCEDVALNLKCVLMLLNVVRKCNALDKLRDENHDSSAWNGIISYELLEMALLDEDEENRLLSLGAIIDNAKCSVPWSVTELSLLSRAVTLTAGVPTPPVRDRMLALLDKFIKRFGEGYRWLLRQNLPDSGENKANYYMKFMEELREQCYSGLLPGVNYTRRHVTLQLLVWIEDMELDGYNRLWKEEYADTLLFHLDDSYENNKVLALHILGKCPKDVLQNCSLSSDLVLETILQRSRSLKPTDSVTAAYQLEALITLLPERINMDSELSCRAHVLRVLLRECAAQCGRAHAPLYTALHLTHSVINKLTPQSIADSSDWQSLLKDVISMCFEAMSTVSWVVNASSPEGLLPTHCEATTTRDVSMTEDGPVTSQMILLCAWRTVKEASACISVGSSLLDAEVRVSCGARLLEALAPMQHRGAFELAARALTHILQRLWCERPSVCEEWLQDSLASLSAAPAHAAAPTRRGAALPYIIQSIVSTEPASRCGSSLRAALRSIRTLRTHCSSRNDSSSVSEQYPNDTEHYSTGSKEGSSGREDRSSCSEDRSINSKEGSSGREDRSICSEDRSSYKEDRSCARCVSARTYALLCTRAILHKCPPAVPDAIDAALHSLDAPTFPERNAATLLWSATMCRIFGPDGQYKMSAYEFFHRYPHLYSIILERLSVDWMSVSMESQTSVAALLLLLARLYPSPDGTLTDIKMDAFVPCVLRACGSRSTFLRRAAARALNALLPRDKYISFITQALTNCTNKNHNYAEGILRSAVALSQGFAPRLEEPERSALRRAVNSSLILYEGVCYPLLHQHAVLLYTLVDKFPDTFNDETLNNIEKSLSQIIFTKTLPPLAIGREICLSHCLYLYYVLLHKRNRVRDIVTLVLETLEHKLYEIVLSTLNYLLLQHNDQSIEDCPYESHLRNKDSIVLQELRKNDTYVNKLKFLLDSNKYLECEHKYLKLLSLERNTQTLILNCQNLSDEEIISKFIERIESLDSDILMHIYMKSLTDFVGDKLERKCLNVKEGMRIMRLLFVYSSSRYSDEVRNVIVKFLEDNLGKLIDLDEVANAQGCGFEYYATRVSMVATLLEDSCSYIRASISRTLGKMGLYRGTKAQTNDRLLEMKHQELGSSEKSVGADETLVGGDETSVGEGETLVGENKSLVGEDETLVGEDETLVGGNKTLVGKDETLGGKISLLGHIVCSARAEALRVEISKGPYALEVLVALALLDFNSEVRYTSDFDPECRVFDQSERYNVYLEESIWTNHCADLLVEKYSNTDISIIDKIYSLISDEKHKCTFEQLGNENVEIFKSFIINGSVKNNVFNPKIELFVRKLRKNDFKLA